MPRNVTLEQPIRVAGVTTRTTNAREMTAAAAIPLLWQRFMRLPAAPGLTYSVYTEYESDVNGVYSVVVGREARGDEAGEKIVTVPAGQYLEFTSTGDMPAAVVAGWQQVWEHFAQPGAPRRAYTADCEIYDPATPCAVRILVALR